MGSVFFLFSYGEAEIAEFSAEGEILSVSEGSQTALLQIELTLTVNKFLVHINADYLREEHGMGAEELTFGNSAFKADGTFLDKRRPDSDSGSSMKAADLELIDISAAFNAAEIGSFNHSGSSEIDDEFAGVPDNIVGEAFRADGDIGHRRVSAGDTGPADSQDIRLIDGTAGDEGSRNRSEQSAALPELFTHNNSLKINLSV